LKYNLTSTKQLHKKGGKTVANLKVNFAGVEFKNPLVLASATLSWDGKGMKIAGLAEIDGVG